jgi:uncharacterized protein (TIGR03083 family)
MTVDAFAAEAANLSAAMASVTGVEFDRPTRCVPWRVRDLLAHVGMATSRVLSMLAEPAPAAPEIDAVGYYRPDARFSVAVNEERVAAASRAGAGTDGSALLRRVDAVWREVEARVAAEPADRVVRTRHGDAMLLDDFMVTRVVELALHGLDLADALERDPWLHDSAAEVLLRLMLPGRPGSTVAALGGDRTTLLRKATGRAPISAVERESLREAGLARLALAPADG